MQIRRQQLTSSCSAFCLGNANSYCYWNRVINLFKAECKWTVSNRLVLMRLRGGKGVWCPEVGIKDSWNYSSCCFRGSAPQLSWGSVCWWGLICTLPHLGLPIATGHCVIRMLILLLFPAEDMMEVLLWTRCPFGSHSGVFQLCLCSVFWTACTMLPFLFRVCWPLEWSLNPCLQHCPCLQSLACTQSRWSVSRAQLATSPSTVSSAPCRFSCHKFDQ